MEDKRSLWAFEGMFGGGGPAVADRLEKEPKKKTVGR